MPQTETLRYIGNKKRKNHTTKLKYGTIHTEQTGNEMALKLRHATRRLIKSKVSFPGLYRFLNEHYDVFILAMMVGRFPTNCTGEICFRNRTMLKCEFEPLPWPIQQIIIYTNKAPGGNWCIPCDIPSGKTIRFWVGNNDVIQIDCS